MESLAESKEGNESEAIKQRQDSRSCLWCAGPWPDYSLKVLGSDPRPAINTKYPAITLELRILLCQNLLIIFIITSVIFELVGIGVLRQPASECRSLRNQSQQPQWLGWQRFVYSAPAMILLSMLGSSASLGTRS